MTILIVCLLSASCLALGLLSVLRHLTDHSTQEAPVFHDLGPNFPDPVAEYREARSQFAWQSRSHSRGPD
jgi:hypothetical protein